MMNWRWARTQKNSIVYETLSKTPLLKTESNNVIQLLTYGPDTNEELFSAFCEGKMNYK